MLYFHFYYVTYFYFLPKGFCGQGNKANPNKNIIHNILLKEKICRKNLIKPQYLEILHAFQ